MINNDPNNLRQKVRKFIDIEGDNSIKTDARLTEFILDNCQIYFTENNRFFCITDIANENYPQYFEVLNARFEKQFSPFRDKAFTEAMATEAIEMRFDFGHTCPNWHEIISLGFAGLKKRAEKYASLPDLDSDQQLFYDSVLKVYRAAERFIKRAITAAKAASKSEIADSLSNLLINPPKTMYEAFQMLLLYHFLQHFGESTWIRTFGRVDSLLYPFYKNTDTAEARTLVSDFIKEINSHHMIENQPFALGGSDKNGTDLINELSYIFIEEYKKLKPPCVKIHVLCSDNVPDEFLKCALDSVRSGANSICFFGDSVLKNTLLRLGINKEDVSDYHVDGCYECGGYGETTCPVTGRVSIAKAAELALNNGCDMLTGYQTGVPVKQIPETFDAFYAEFLCQLSHLSDCIKTYAAKMESLYPKLHAGLLYSSTFPECMENGKDIFTHCGAKYNNSSICGVGLATATDSLMAIKKLVYDDKTLSLSELSSLMKNNWKDNEKLRLTAKNKFPKYGMGNAEADYYASDIVKNLAKMINGQPNARGGVYRLGTHSITARWVMGEKLAATPDGRYAGETTSLNSGASFGADREGITAHIISATRVDATYCPNSFTLDLDLHSSAVKGEDGLCAMLATLKTYLGRNGFSVHYNVLDAQTLRKAQKNPEDYPNLQVRVCGWNILFSMLSKQEQDEYITRFEAIS